MILTRVFPVGGATVDLDDADARERIAELYRPPRAQWLRLNLISTLSGNAAGPDGTSESITNAVDRIILNVIRSLADVVVVGAASVRAEGYFVPRRAALAVVTRSGDFSGHQITSSGDRGPLLILCPAASADRARDTIGNSAAQILVVPDDDGSLSATAIVDALRAAGYASIVAEGGPEIASHLVLGNVVDELCLTTSAQLNGGALPLFGSTEFAPISLGLEQLLLDDGGATYARWSVPRR